MVWINYIMLLPSKSSRADVYSSSFDFEYDLTVDRSETGTETDQTFSEIFELQYSQMLLPRLDVDFKLILELENEFQSDGEDTTRFLPEAEIGGKAEYWELNLGAQRTRESNDQPFEPTSIQDSYFIEYFFEPSEKVPDLKLKYTVDTDEQGDDTDSQDTSFEVSSVYEFAKFLKLKVDYTRDESEDRITPDSDTIDEDLNTEETFKYVFSSNLKFDFKHQYQKTTGGTLLDAGGKTNETNTENNTYDGKVDLRLFEETEMGATYQFEREDDIIERGISESTDFELNFDQRIGEPIDFSFTYSRTIDEDISIDNNIRDTEDTFTYDVSMGFSNLLDFSIKYEKRDTDTEDRLAPANDKKIKADDISASWSADTETFMDLTVSYDWSQEKENGIMTTKDRDLSIKSDLDFEAIRLQLTPEYTLTITEDLTKPSEQKSRNIDFNFGLDYETEVTDRLRFSLSHAYGRSEEHPNKVIERDDDTTIDINLDEPWEGSNFTLTVSRTATDRSGDDSPPDITSTITFNWDHTMGPFDFSVNYSYDKNKLTDDSETFDVNFGWKGLNFDTQLKYSFDKTFSSELDETHNLTFSFKVDF
ncbi:MAG: hypothetical protein GTO00_02400 [Deltaproteobacteria bacterium]|nr:hypothetical protein [Deltaproteobacteria bacterium]